MQHRRDSELAAHAAGGRPLHACTAAGRARRAFLLISAGLGLALGAAPGQAHDARPLSVTIVEQTVGVYRGVVRAPPTIEAANAPRVVWPASCDILESAPLSLAFGSTSLIVCPAGLGGREVRIEYPVYNPSITTLFRVEPLAGASITAVLPPDRLDWTVPVEPGRATVARDYTALGFAHIWLGPDHLLFVAGMLLLARVPRRIVLAVTGFTAAHSITLSLAALGLVSVPIGPVEAMIALSIVFLAAEIARGDPDSFSHRYPIALAFVFGLLHGFGFASALGEIGLPRIELVTGLLFFNAGVELGQLTFIAVVAALAMLTLRAWRQLAGRAPVAVGRPHGAPGAARWSRVGAYLLGVPAAYWFLERTVSALLV